MGFSFKGMEIPETLASALSALATLRADLAASESISSELSAQVEALTNLSNEHIASFDGLNAKHTLALNEIAELKTALSAQEEQASAKANTILANLAVEPVAILSEDTKAKTRTELWAEYNALPVEARNDFYAKHRYSLRS